MFRTIVALAALLIAGTASAQPPSYASLRRFGMEYGKIINNRDAYFSYADPGTEDGEAWAYSVAANFDLDLIKYGALRLFWDQQVKGAATDRQFRSVYWDYNFGLRFGDKVSVYESHRSVHVLDARGQGDFPLRNEYILAVDFYRRRD